VNVRRTFCYHFATQLGSTGSYGALELCNHCRGIDHGRGRSRSDHRAYRHRRSRKRAHHALRYVIRTGQCRSDDWGDHQSGHSRDLVWSEDRRNGAERNAVCRRAACGVPDWRIGAAAWRLDRARVRTPGLGANAHSFARGVPARAQGARAALITPRCAREWNGCFAPEKHPCRRAHR
jgi:hypothetical protein